MVSYHFQFHLYNQSIFESETCDDFLAVSYCGKLSENFLSGILTVRSIPNGHMHFWTYGPVNAPVHEKVLVLFQESFDATTIFLQLRHYLLDVFKEVRIEPIKSKLPYMASACCVIYYCS